MLHEPLKDRTAGQWASILAGVGIASHHLRNRHGPCPMCGGKDRFRYDDKGGRGTWICSQCGAGDGIELVKRFLGIDFKTAAVEIEKHIGTGPVLRAGKPAENDDRVRYEMIDLWKRGEAVSMGNAAGRYLNGRTGMLDFPAASCLRFAGDERYVEAGAKASWHPAMIALVQPSDAAIAEGEKSALHRTYLTADGDKANVSSPRKMMGSMPTGAAVRLMHYTNVIGIAEGIETALSASLLHDVPCWAALTAGLLERWNPPVGIEAVFIYGDNDHSATGQAAAFALCARLKHKGLQAFVELPPMGQDWNDVLVKKLDTARRMLAA